MEPREKRKEKIEKFFENMSEEELDDLLERNGINDGKSCANLSPTQSLGVREPVKA